MHKCEVLIIGQGLCGSWLSHYLMQAGVDCLVSDEDKPGTASKIASGIINPITGRRHVKTWMIDDVMPFAVEAYKVIDDGFIQQKNTLDFFPSRQMKESFRSRIKEEEYSYLQLHQSDWHSIFNYENSIGEINPCWLVNVNDFIQKQKEKLNVQSRFIHDTFNEAFLVVLNDKIQYKNITADKIIFCDGILSASSSYFNYLPFALNKGEALLVECPDLPDTYLYKNGKTIVPWKKDIFWAGSSFQWDYKDANPSIQFYQEMEIWLASFLKLPYKIVNHFSSLRPANTERRPFVGFHPVYSNVGILNGMGTKGVSLAPYFAKQLADAMLKNEKINPEADIQRFSI